MLLTHHHEDHSGNAGAIQKLTGIPNSACGTKYDYLLDLADRAHALARQGVRLLDITKRLLGGENMMSVLSRYNFSERNLVASCLEVDISRYRQPGR